MKSWFHIGGGAEAGLSLRDVPEPTAAAGELVVRVRAASLNRGEFLGRRRLPPDTAEKAAGNECAGEVVATGAGVSGFSVGDRVMGRAEMAFSEYAILYAGTTMKVPQSLEWDEAACTSIAYLVAHDVLWTQGDLQPEDWLLVAGVTSGVGVAALQLGKLIGARVIGTSRAEHKLEKLRAHGLDFGLEENGEELVARVMEITDGKGVALALNNVGGSLFPACLQVLAYKGGLATVGQVDGVGRVELDLSRQHAQRLRLFGVSNRNSNTDELTENVAKFSNEVLPSFAEGRLRPLIDSHYNFTDLPGACARMESDQHLGKIVIRF